MDFLLVSIEHFSPNFAAEALQAKTDRNSVSLLQRGLFDPKFQVEGSHPAIILARIVRPNECLTTMSLTVFTQRNFVADFLQEKCDFTPKTAVLRFLSSFG